MLNTFIRFYALITNWDRIINFNKFNVYKTEKAMMVNKSEISSNGYNITLEIGVGVPRQLVYKLWPYFPVSQEDEEIKNDIDMPEEEFLKYAPDFSKMNPIMLRLSGYYHTTNTPFLRFKLSKDLTEYFTYFNTTLS